MNETGHWKYPNSVSGDYTAFHKSGGKSLYVATSEELLVGAFDKGTFVVTGL